MANSLSTSTNSNSWEIVPTNTFAGVVLAILFCYLFFRHFIFVLMFMDIILGSVRKFNWFPNEGKRRKTLIHWFVALGLFFGFLAVSGSAGWLKFIPQ